MRQGRALALAIVVGLGWPGAATAALRYAEPAGDGPEATCPAANPCDLSTAVEGPSVANGDEIVVLPGRHVLPGEVPDDGHVGANFLSISRSIWVHGAPGAPPTIVEGPIATPVYVDDPGAVVSDVIIEGSIGLTTGMAERVSVRRIGNYACYFSKVGGPAEPDPLIRDSVCQSLPEGGRIGWGVATDISGSPPRSITGRLVNVTAIGSYFGVMAGAREGSSATIEGTNVIAIGAGDADASANTEGNASADGVAATLSLENSNFSTVNLIGAGASVTPPGSGTNQTAEPILASPSTGDVRQVIGSPTIDAGAVVPLLGSFDFEGQARIQGPAPDIGGDEGSILTPFRLSAAARRSLRDLGVIVRCAIPTCGFEISGSIRLKGGKGDRAGTQGRASDSFELKPRSLTLGAGEKRKVKVKLFPTSRKKIERLLADGAKAQAVIDVDTGSGGFADRERVRINPGG